MTKLRIIVILPAYNEQGKVGEVVKGVLSFNHDLVKEVLVVDDGSTDDTSREAEEAGAVSIRQEKNHGAGAAIRVGIDCALERKCDICVIMGADCQDDPAEIPKLVEPILKYGYDLVQGSRYLDTQRTVNMPLNRAITTRLYTLFFRLVSGFPITDGSNGFRAFRLGIFEKIDIWEKDFNGYDLEPYILLQAIKKGFRVKEVSVVKKFDTEKGFSKMIPVKDWYFILKPLLTQFLKGLMRQPGADKQRPDD